jgi:hypothetical protein
LLLELGRPPDSKEGALSETETDCYAIQTFNNEDFGYEEIIRFLKELELPIDATATHRKEIHRRNKPYTLIGETLYWTRSDGILRRAVDKKEAQLILEQCHEGVCGGHFAQDTAAHKILLAGYFWPSMFKDCSSHCKICQTCQAYAKRAFPHTALRLILPTSAFEKWGLDFVGPLPTMVLRNKYLIVATDYLTKWTEAAAIRHNTKHEVVEIFFNQIICHYGCPLEIVSDQGFHFINELIQELLQKMSVKHR